MASGTLGPLGRARRLRLHRRPHAAGYEIDFLSPKGGLAPMDGVDRSDPINAAFLDGPTLVARTRETVAITAVDPARYDAVCHGPAALMNAKLADGTYLVAGQNPASATGVAEATVALVEGR